MTTDTAGHSGADEAVALADAKSIVEDRNHCGHTDLIVNIFRSFLAMSAELTRLREASAWRPIETAPKDGTRMLLVKAGYRATCGNFNKIHQMWATNYAEDYEDSEEFVRLIQDASYRPTHWQPLPASPAKAAQGDGESQEGI